MKQADLCRQLGVTQGALSGWETGRHEPDISALRRIAAIFDVSVDCLLGLDAHPKRFERIPVLKTIPADAPIGAVDAGGRFETIGAEYLHSGHSYIGLQTSGDSMRPVYENGDIVIVRIQPTAEDGDDAVVFVGGQDAILRRYCRTTRGIILRPLHPEEAPLSFSGEEIDARPIRILGIAVEIRRKLRE